MDRLVSVVVLIFVVAHFVACTHKGDGVQSGPEKPTVTISPASPSVIGITDVIVLTFGKSMDIDSLLVEGSLGASSDGGTWGTFSKENDTLTIAPKNVWALGKHDLLLDVDSSDGANLKLSLVYTVASAPTSISNPPSNSQIQNSTPIVITFDQAMEPNTLSLAGSSMVSDGGQWSTTSYENDVLTLSPVTQWQDGEQSIVYQASSSQGISSGPTTLQYTVDSTTPTVNEMPPTGSVIGKDINIVLLFSEAIDRSSLSASGQMWDERSGITWSSNKNLDDTLSIMAGPWTNGSKPLNIVVTDVAGNRLSKSFSYLVDVELPVASANPLNGGVILQNTPVIIRFTESMDTSSLLASGTLWDQSNGGVWSTQVYLNDTLTFSPSTSWSLSDQPSNLTLTLTLDAKDLYGNALGSYSLAYSVGCPTGLTGCAGECVDLDSDEANCGTCGHLCSLPNATSVCSSGVCQVAYCNPNFSDCNGNRIDGCEVATSTDANNCGSCGVACIDSLPCTTDSCTNSQCTYTSTCSDLVGAWGACVGASTCALTGTQTRTITPQTCTAQGCANGTSYTETRPCSRNTDGISCGPGRECLHGICICLTC